MTSFPLLAPHKWRPLGAAWTIALLSSLAVLFVGEVMGQAPCDLCWFQRAFMFPLAIILGIAAFKSDRAVIPYGLALAAGGSLVALYHSLLYAGVIPAPIVPCTGGPSCSGESMAIGGEPLCVLSLTSFAIVFNL